MLHCRKSFGVRISSARKLGLERLEDRSMLSVVTAALLSNASQADDTPAAQADTSTGESAVQPLIAAPAENVSGATVTNASKNVAVSVDLALLMGEQNQPPVIIDFGAMQEEGDFWSFYGTVTDPDDELTSLVVSFGGLLEDYHLTATVESGGVFSVKAQCPGLEFGLVTAQAHDPHGALSNVAEVWVFPV